MITIKLANGQTFTFDRIQNEVLLNNQPVKADWITIGPNKYHVIVNHQSHSIEFLGADESGKHLTLVVNGQKQIVQVEDKYDVLLKQLGMDKLTSSKVNEVKAPMPGLVLRLLVTEGQSVQKGDPLLVLEAMKMENIIKAAGEGIVQSIKVQPKLVVEKNQVMIVMA